MSGHPKNYCPVFGNYPKEYNRAVHGPYYPWVNYGPRDTPFHEVKLGEFKSWFARRNKTPQAAIAAISRALMGYQYRWNNTRYGSPSKFFFQLAAMGSFVSMLAMYGTLRDHRNHKYHW